MRGAYLAVLFGASVAGAPAAQEPQPQAPQPQAPQPQQPQPQTPQPQPQLTRPPSSWVLVDRVVKTVNDSAILESNLRTVAAGLIRAHISQHGSITPAERQEIYERSLERLVDDYRLAKAAASLGPQSAEQIEQIVQSELQRAVLEQERDIGVNEMSREFKRTNRTLAAVQSEQRIDLQKRIAEDMTVHRRLMRQGNLYVTPRMLRETFARFRKDFFEREAAARVVGLRFRGEGARERAAAAAEMWRKEGLDLQQMAARFPNDTVIPELDATTLSSELAPITKFALAGPEGAVADPVPMGDGFLVARVSQFQSELHGHFEDPDVQRKLQTLCERLVRNEFHDEAMARAKDRTEVWP